VNKTLLVADRVRPAPPDANALLIDERGAVEAVGAHRDLSAGGGGTTVTYPGGVILPGLRDAHLHPVPLAALLRGISLKAATDIDDLVARLRHGGKAATAVVAFRMDDETLAERRLPTRHDLDRAFADRPVLVHRYCGHIAVANSAALALAGLDTATADPAGGTIDRAGDGAPTGVLRETAIEPVAQALAGTAPVQPAHVLDVFHALSASGITSVGAILRLGDGPWASLGNEAALVAAVADDLPLRVHGFVSANSVEELDEGRRLLTGRSARLRWAGLKRYADGSLGGHTAAMHDDFSDEPGRGTLRLGTADHALIEACWRRDGIAAIHAIGDRACAAVLDLLEGASAPAGSARLEHASVIGTADIARMARLGVVACVQPSFLGSEAQWLERRVGAARLPSTYPFRTMSEAGVVLAGGSDAPVESPDPWAGMALARDRNGIHLREALDAESALEMFTVGGAAALGEPPPLAPGSPADLVVVDRDPLGVDPDGLRATEVEAVWIGGSPRSLRRDLLLWLE
jgi:predicted amidohydrolase YtcJ